MDRIRCNTTDYNGVGHGCNLDRLPDKCPVCHHGTNVTPPPPGTFIDIRDLQGTVIAEFCFRCPMHRCSHFFISSYVRAGSGTDAFDYAGSLPLSPHNKEFHPDIEKLSPQFVNIWNQAVEAESRGLSEICGMGYRKALEFLIKDYAARCHPDQVERIRKSWLKNCIQEYIDDNRLKECATMSAYLGNDETHYYRKWKDKDVTHLKMMIEIAVGWIHNEMTFATMRSEMLPESEAAPK